jgi:hypothetical protein
MQPKDHVIQALGKRKKSTLWYEAASGARLPKANFSVNSKPFEK